MADEIAAASDGDGPRGPLVDRTWLVLQRLEDIGERMDGMESLADSAFHRRDDRTDRLESRLGAGFRQQDG